MGATQSTPTPPSGAGKNTKNNSGAYGAGIRGDRPSALPSAAPFGRPDDGLRGGRGVIGSAVAGEVGNQQVGRSGGFATQQQAGTPRDRIELYPFSTVPQKGTASSGDFSYKIGHPVPTDDELKDMVRDERYWAKDDATRNRWRDHVAGQFARAYGGKRPTVELYDGVEHAAPSVDDRSAHNPAPHDPAMRSSGEHSPQHPGEYPPEYPPGHPVHRYARQWAARQAERQLLQAERAQAERAQAEQAKAKSVRADTLEGGAGRDPLAAQGGVGLNIAAIKGGNAGPAAPTYPSADASGASSGIPGDTPDGTIPSGASQPGQQARLTPPGDNRHGDAAGSYIPPRPEFTGKGGKGHVAHIGVEDWETFHPAIDGLPHGPAAKRAMREIVSAEGGLRPDGTTVTGMTEVTLDKLIKNASYTRELASAGITADTKPADLSPEQHVKALEVYLTDAISKSKSTWDGAKDKDKRISGLDVLDGIGNSDVAAAIADTLVRHGPGEGGEAIQQAINRTAAAQGIEELSRVKLPLTVDGAFGSESVAVATALVKDPRLAKLFLDNMAGARIATLKKAQAGAGNPPQSIPEGEIIRANHFRLSR